MLTTIELVTLIGLDVICKYWSTVLTVFGERQHFVLNTSINSAIFVHQLYNAK